ncbi:MAG: hypothetical protein LH468_08455 [Nocardioides sp.]|nr:hypothetical protein [Nocardioides sp.]
MGHGSISWASLSPPETAGLMDRWEQQRAVRVPWLAGRVEQDGEHLTFDTCGVAAVGRWCSRWFADPDGVGDQPPAVWVERFRGSRPCSRLRCSLDATVVADAVAGFVESVLWADLPDARRLFTPCGPRGAGPLVGVNEPGLGYGARPGEVLPWQLLRAARCVAVHGTSGADLDTALIRTHAQARARLVASRACTAPGDDQ